MHIQRDQVTMYRGWEITSEDGIKVIMWDTHLINREPGDVTLELTLGTPNGRRGMKVLSQVELTLIGLGAQKLT